MNFTKRKVCIEFLSTNRCRVTTPFYQKEFNVTKDFILDLITFKSIDESYLPGEIPFKFFIAFYCHDTNKYKYAEACVLVQTSDFDVEPVDSATFVNNNKIFTVSVWDGD